MLDILFVSTCEGTLATKTRLWVTHKVLKLEENQVND